MIVCNHIVLQQDKSVARSKFDGMCQELNNALDRERQAEAILTEQSQRLNELNVQLDLQVAHFIDQEQKFSGATKVVVFVVNSFVMLIFFI